MRLPFNHNTFTDGSKTNDGVAAAAVSTRNYKKSYACRLPGDSSIYTDELRAILLTLKLFHHSKEKSILIVSDSLSALQAVHNLKYNHPVLIKIHELYSQLIQEQREIGLSGFPAMLASYVIMQQILLLRMPLMAISRMNSSPFLTSNLV